MKKARQFKTLRSAIFRLLSVFALAGMQRTGLINYYDHIITGKLGSRSQWGFDVHKYHLKAHKNRRRR